MDGHGAPSISGLLALASARVVHRVCAGDERRKKYAGFPKGYCVIFYWGGGVILQCKDLRVHLAILCVLIV
jgi:hypothetical protein